MWSSTATCGLQQSHVVVNSHMWSSTVSCGRQQPHVVVDSLVENVAAHQGGRVIGGREGVGRLQRASDVCVGFVGGQPVVAQEHVPVHTHRQRNVDIVLFQPILQNQLAPIGKAFALVSCIGKCESSFCFNNPLYRVAQKVGHYQILNKMCQIVLKSIQEIRFLRQIKKMIKHYNIFRLF